MTLVKQANLNNATFICFLFHTTGGSTKSTGRKARVSQIEKEIPEALPIPHPLPPISSIQGYEGYEEEEEEEERKREIRAPSVAFSNQDDNEEEEEEDGENENTG